MIASATAMHGDEPSAMRGRRRHFQLVDKQGFLYYQATVINESSQELGRNRVLLHDVNYGDFVISRLRSYAEQTTTLTFSDKVGKAYARLKFKWPYTSKTLDDTLKEARRHPELENAPVIAILETNGGKWEAVETEWRGIQRLRELRTDVRRSMDFTLLEAIERMRSMALGIPDIEPVAKMITTYIVHGTEGEIMVTLVDSTMAPDCEFDKSFGVPCSDRQLERIKKANEEHRQLEEY
jgi:hypothetical protein